MRGKMENTSLMTRRRRSAHSRDRYRVGSFRRSSALLLYRYWLWTEKAGNV